MHLGCSLIMIDHAMYSRWVVQRRACHQSPGSCVDQGRAHLLLGLPSSSSLSSLSDIGAGMFSTRVPSASSYSAKLRTSPLMLYLHMQRIHADAR